MNCLFFYEADFSKAISQYFTQDNRKSSELEETQAEQLIGLAALQANRVPAWEPTWEETQSQSVLKKQFQHFYQKGTFKIESQLLRKIVVIVTAIF